MTEQRADSPDAGAPRPPATTEDRLDPRRLGELIERVRRQHAALEALRHKQVEAAFGGA
ncbi:hypothetical protein ACFU3E_22335 [Streptomyces sp. NPDC057424]|uniref:hypothetical protein n=1 Tax=Streptomyces sp. NPDC057424 TaxID=3346127 RepID=UPI0036A0F809